MLNQAVRLTPEHWHELQHVVQRRALGTFRRHGLFDEADAHAMLSWQGAGGFSAWRGRASRSILA